MLFLGTVRDLTGEQVTVALDLFHGDAGFKPADWRVKIAPTFNLNMLGVEELAIVNPNVLKGIFRMNGEQAYRVMVTAHQRGACVVAIYTKDVAETKATEGTDAGRKQGYPLLFTTEPEE